MYKFDINLLKLSKSNDLQTAKKEWYEIYREHRPEKTGLCICQHTLKNIIYMYNKCTKYTIGVGTSCCKKFNLHIIKFDNNALKHVMSEMLIKGEYQIINNILEYTNNIQSQLIKYVRTEYENNITNVGKLTQMQNDVQILINEYNLNYLQDIYDEISDKIKWEHNQEVHRKEQERINFEKIQLNNRLEFERKQKERIDDITKIKERLEFERIQNEHLEFEKMQNKCVCGIMKTNICICNNPKYELVKISNNLYCVRCNKWKCRCK